MDDDEPGTDWTPQEILDVNDRRFFEEMRRCHHRSIIDPFFVFIALHLDATVVVGLALCQVANLSGVN